MISRISLVDSGREFVFLDKSIPNRNEVVLTKLDVSSPDVRESTRLRVGADGVIDSTWLAGARAVSIEARIGDWCNGQPPAAVLDDLQSYLHPSKRPYLVVTDDAWAGGSTRRMQLRSSQWGGEIIHTGSWYRDIQVSWVCPDGVWEATDAGIVSFYVAADGAEGGRVYDLVSPRTYPPAGGTGTTVVTNMGSNPADWTARLYGPCSGPRFTLDNSGESIVFKSSFYLGLNEFVELNSKDFTVHANGDPTITRSYELDFTQTTWFKIPPGTSTLRYHPVADVDTGCHAEGEFRPSWL